MSNNTPKSNEIPYGFCQCGCGERTNVRNGKRNRFLHNHHNYVRKTRADMTREEIAAEFWEKADKGDPGECWEWREGCFPNGYGCFWDGSAAVGAHRFAYSIEHGPIPEGVVICHTCDNKPCVNPAHLFAGEQQNNTDDMFEKGRANKAAGETHGLARFTNKEVRKFRRAFSQMNISMQAFARMHNVPDETMRRLLKRITYQDV